MSDRYLWVNNDGDVAHPNAPAGGGGQGHFKSAAPLASDAHPLADVPHPFSPIGHNVVLNDEQKQQMLDAGTADAGAADEVPVFNATTPVPVDVRADSVEAFVSNTNTAMGGVGTAGHMEPKFAYDLEIDSKGRVAKVNMVVNTKIVRPRFAGGRPSDSDRALIKKAEDLIKKHEERHRDIARDHAARAVKAMRGKSADKAKEIFNDFMKQMDKAQDAFDAKEGMLFVDHNGPAGTAGPATDVRAGPIPKAGPKKP